MSYETHEVILRLGSNQNRGSFPLGKKLEHIVELRIDEYAFRTPNGGAVTPSLWRIWFGGRFFDSPTSNAGSKGYPIVIDNATLTHVVYERPRVVSTQNNGELNHIDIDITDENTNAVTFDDGILYLTFVCKVPKVSPALVMQEHYDYNMDHGAAHTTGIPGIDMPK